jgi:hypothetical protein
MDSTDQFLKGAYEFIPCQLTDRPTVVSDLTGINFEHMISPPYVILQSSGYGFSALSSTAF